MTRAIPRGWPILAFLAAVVALAGVPGVGPSSAAPFSPELGTSWQGSVDCGRSGMLDPAAAACFEERSRACEPATWVLEVRLGERSLAQRWEIVGPTEVGCTVRGEYLAYADPAYLGKELLCAFDQSRPFVEAVRDLRACDGPLLDFLAGVGDTEREFAVERGGPRQVERTTPPAGGQIALTVRRPLRAEYLGRGDDGHAVAVEHTDDPSCGRQELLLPTRKGFRCGGVDYLLVVNPARSDDDRVTFGLFEVQHG